MNNLKRVLSLALASVMLIGMMVVGASAADFSDADEIQHTEAVDILVALGVVNGKEDGSYFDPTGDVTRGEMAKMIAVAMKGGNDVATGTKGVPSFTDISGHWAESYIEYCFDLGIIAGRGDGTFDPNGLVTGTEVTKMVLTALGYDPTAYGLVGASWATRTDELARKADPQLFNELSGVTLNVPATRDTAAQIIWNGLQNDTMEYAPQTNKSNGEITWAYQNSGKTMLKERYDGDIITGKFTGNSWNTAAEKGSIEVYSNAAKDTSLNTQNINPNTAMYFPSDLDIDFVGEEVKVIYKNGTRSSTKAPDKNDIIYGVFVTGTTNVIRTTKDKLSGVDDKAQLEVNKVKYDLHLAGVNVYVNHDGVNDGSIDFTSATRNTFSGTAQLTAGRTGYDDDASVFTTALFGAKNTPKENGDRGVRGDAVKIILNDSNEITDLYFTVPKIGLVTGVSSDKVTISGVGSVKISTNDVYDGIAKDDVVEVTTFYDNKTDSDDAYSIVKKAESVTGIFKGYKGTENVVIDGTTYKTRNKSVTNPAFLVDSSLKLKAGSEFSTLLSGEAEVELFLIDGYAASIKEVTKKNTNYSVVTQVVTTTSSTKDAFDALKIEVMDRSGTKTVLTLDDSSKKLDGVTKIATNRDIHVGDIVTYSIKSNGKANVQIEGVAISGTAGYDKDTKTVKVDNKTYVTTSDAVLFVQTDAAKGPSKGSPFINEGEYKAYSIRDVKTIADATVWGTVVVDEDNKALAAFLDNTTAKSSGSDAVYGIVNNVVGSVLIDNTDYVRYNVRSGAETYILNVEQKTATLANRDFVYFTPTSDELYEVGDVVKVTAAKANEDNDTACVTYVKEYDAAGKIVTVWNNVTGTDATGYAGDTVAGTTTYALDDDAKVFFFDYDAKTALDSGSVTAFDTTTGYRNVILVIDKTKTNLVNAILVEVGGEKNFPASI